ncbi:unnamed protein product [Protopolystoma xenopodis]|uniref:Uncharacterized protein n=1 Tax=Protopolystoma xenopodis TaxID=117903 RepID=A0A448WDP0_9PLAT|nr:unnamed protein product [Protopolystoma xenopodis]
MSAKPSKWLAALAILLGRLKHTFRIACVGGDETVIKLTERSQSLRGVMRAVPNGHSGLDPNTYMSLLKKLYSVVGLKPDWLPELSVQRDLNGAGNHGAGREFVTLESTLDGFLRLSEKQEGGEGVWWAARVGGREETDADYEAVAEAAEAAAERGCGTADTSPISGRLCESGPKANPGRKGQETHEPPIVSLDAFTHRDPDTLVSYAHSHGQREETTGDAISAVLASGAPSRQLFFSLSPSLARSVALANLIRGQTVMVSRHQTERYHGAREEGVGSPGKSVKTHLLSDLASKSRYQFETQRLGAPHPADPFGTASRGRSPPFLPARWGSISPHSRTNTDNHHHEAVSNTDVVSCNCFRADSVNGSAGTINRHFVRRACGYACTGLAADWCVYETHRGRVDRSRCRSTTQEPCRRYFAELLEEPSDLDTNDPTTPQPDLYDPPLSCPTSRHPIHTHTHTFTHMYRQKASVLPSRRYAASIPGEGKSAFNCFIAGIVAQLAGRWALVAMQPPIVSTSRINRQMYILW